MSAEFVSQAEFARRLGVERSYITLLKQAGRLVMTEDGKVDVAASEAKIAATADPGKSGVADRHARQRTAPTKEVQPRPTVNPEKPQKIEMPEESADDDAPATPDYQKARARREQANAELAELELAEKAGSLYAVGEVDAVVADAGTIFRTSLDSRRPLLVSQLAALSNEADIRLFLEDQDEQLLADLAARFSALAGES